MVKKYQAFSIVFALLAVLLSNVMCASLAYSYCNLKWGGQYLGYSVPPRVAFLLSIPYGIGIAICAGLALFFYKKYRHSEPMD